jgi:oxygen-independent coproporphyrinogen-3 oxidase
MDDVYGTVIEPFVREGLLWEKEDQIGLTRKGILISNQVLCEFLF